MTISVTHTTQTATPDSADGKISADAWNEEHLVVDNPITDDVDYYVSTSGDDSNDGSIGSPWRTLTHAVDVTAQVHNPGLFFIRVNVADGAYAESVFPPKNRTSFQPVWFIGNVTTPANVTTDSVYATGGDWLFRGFTLNGASAVGRTTLYIVDCAFGDIDGGFCLFASSEANIIAQDIEIVGTSDGYIFASDHAYVTHKHGKLQLSVDPLWPSGCLSLKRFSKVHFAPDVVTGTSSGIKVFNDGTNFLDCVNSISDVPGATTGSLGNGSIFHTQTEVFSAWDTLTVADEAYDATGWDADLSVPTKNAVRDKIEGLTPVGKQTIWIPASAMSDNGAEATSRIINSIKVPVLAFDAASDEGANFSIAFPKSWNASSITYQAFWTAAGGSGTVEFELSGGCFINDAAINISGLGTAVAVGDTLITADDLHVSSESSAVTLSNAADDAMTFFNLIRDVSDDTLGVDAELIGLKLCYTTDTGNDA